MSIPVCTEGSDNPSLPVVVSSPSSALSNCILCSSLLIIKIRSPEMTGEEKYRISRRGHFVISYNQYARQLIPHHQGRPTTGQRHFLTRTSENRHTGRVTHISSK